MTGQPPPLPRFTGDPPADAAVARLMALAPPLDPRGDSLLPEQSRLLAEACRAMAQWRCNGDLGAWPATGIDPAVADALRPYLADCGRLPDWADGALIARAGERFVEDGPVSCALLFCASLPECYVMPDLAAVLHASGQLEQHTLHRIRSTAALIFPVMLRGGLTSPQGSGVAQALKVRLIHATIRHLILRGEPGSAKSNRPIEAAPLQPGDGLHEILLALGWDTARRGMPCNQLELAYTLLTFGYVTVRGLRTLGQPLAPEDEAAVMHTWNVVGHLIGVQADGLPTGVEDAALRFAAMQAQCRAHPPADDARPALARDLMHAMAAALPVVRRHRALRGLPVLFTRRLCGAETARDLGLDAAVPRGSVWAFLALTAAVRVVDAVGRRIAPGFSLARLATRVLGYELTVHLLMGQTRPLALPDAVVRHTAVWRGDRRAPRWLRRLELRMTAGSRGALRSRRHGRGRA